MRLPDHLLAEILNKTNPLAPYDLSITPMPTPDKIKGVTVDLALGGEFRTFIDKEFCTEPLDLASPTLKTDINRYMSEKPISLKKGERITIRPGELLLGITEESVKIPTNLVGWLDGRSTLARVGLQVHATAHRIDPGWDGKIVLEFINAGPIPLTLTVGMHVCSISFETIGAAVRKHMGNNLYGSELIPLNSQVEYAKNPDSKFGSQDTVITAGGRNE